MTQEKTLSTLTSSKMVGTIPNFGQVDLVSRFWASHSGIHTLVLQTHGSLGSVGLNGQGYLIIRDFKKNTILASQFKDVIKRIESGGTLVLLGVMPVTAWTPIWRELVQGPVGYATFQRLMALRKTLCCRC